MNRLMIAGGGTGGHLFPGVAVAEEFLRRDPTIQVLFVGAGRPVEQEVLSARGLPSRTIRASGLKGMSLWGRVKSLFSIPVGIIQAIGVIRQFKPQLVLGVGGYVSGPLGLAARILRVPTAIQEQNSVPGITNRLLGRVVDLIFISFESSRKYFPENKIRLTGNPIRSEIVRAAEKRAEKPNGGFTLLIAGGSQGAHAINLAAVGAVKVLRNELSDLAVIHQTGTADLEPVLTAYRDLGVTAEVQPFFQDMERVYAAADLIVCRAGALTLAEIAAMSLPSVLIPLPTAADNHQEINALSLVNDNAAEMILQKDLTPVSLAEIIGRLAADRSRLATMGDMARKAARPDATERICDVCDEHAAQKN